MSTYFIREVSVEGFRGINNENDPLVLTFASDRINSVFAPNAQGKSSIFEALSYLIKGNIPKLASLQASERPDTYYSNLFHSLHTATIKVTFEPSDGTQPIVVSLVRNPDGSRSVSSPSGHQDPEQFLSSLDNEFCLLDNRTFLRFIEDSPLGRGRSFSALLGLRAISEMRQALEVLSNAGTINRDFNIATLQTRADALARRKLALEAQLRTSYQNLLGRAAPQVIERDVILREVTAALIAVPLLAPLLSGQTVADVSFDQLRQAIRDAERSDLQDKMRSLSSSIVELAALAPSGVDVEQFEFIRALTKQQEAALAATKGPLLRAHFRTGLQVLRSTEWQDPSLCPTCDLHQDTPLEPRLAQKLAEYDNVELLGQQISKAWSRGPIGQKLGDLFNTTKLAIDASDKASYLPISSSLRAGEPISLQIDQLAILWNKAEALRQSALQQMECERNVTQQALPPSLVTLTEQVSYAEQMAGNLNELSTSQEELATLTSRLDIRSRWSRFVQGASSLFDQAEVALSTSMTASLEAQYKSMYFAMTTNPSVIPRLVKSPGSEDLHLSLENFYGLTGLSARALLSESHRNAFALSIFLSAALKSRTPSSFVILDDVTSSFDAGHQFGLMELLRTTFGRPTNPSGPQVIILSHDSLLEKYFDRISTEAPWTHQRLQGMPPQGTIFTQAQDANRLRSNANRFLMAGQLNEGIPLVRQYLEFTLLEIIRKVNIPVPLDFSIRDDKKMVQNCIDAVKAALDLQTRAGGLILSAQQLQQFSAVLVPSLVANWLSHYSTATGAGFTPQVLIHVLDTVDLVADCFKYDCNCSGAHRRRYYKTLASKQCHC